MFTKFNNGETNIYITSTCNFYHFETSEGPFQSNPFLSSFQAAAAAAAAQAAAQTKPATSTVASTPTPTRTKTPDKGIVNVTF